MPVPDTLTAGEFDALLEKDTVPVALPLLCGVNVTVSVADCPADSVVGIDRPDNVNSPLFELSDEIVTLAPLAVRVVVKLLDEPTTTLPKLRLVGEADS